MPLMQIYINSLKSYIMQKKTCLTSVGQILLELEAFRSSYMNILLKVRKCILILLEGTESTAFV